jgi:thioredoxin 2
MSTLGLDDAGVLVRCPSCGQRNRLRYESLGAQGRCGQCKTELSPPASTVAIDSANQFRSLTQRSALPVLIDFWAPWCGPCKMVAPELEKVASQLSGQLLLAKLNTEQVPEVAASFGISSIPTLCLFRHGKEVARQAGASPAPAILNFISARLGGSS